MTIAQFFQTSPEKANELFAKLAETGPGAVKARERLFEELKAELELHARLEREHLVPALRKHDETKGLVPGLADDSKQVAKLLGELEKAPKDADEFLNKVRELQRTFQQHVRDERKELLPLVKKALSREEADAVAEAIGADKAALEAAKRAEAEARRAEERRLRQAEELRAERTADAEKEAKRAAVEVRHVTRAGAEIGRQSIQGAERAMRTAADALTSASASSARAFEQSFQQVGRATEQAGHRIAAMADYRSAMTGAVQEGAQAWMAWAQGAAATNAAGLQALLACRSAPEVAAVQSRIFQEHVALMLAGSRRVSAAATRTSGGLFGALGARAEADAPTA